jgi:Na+/H+-translocating membrane pyrophosphatase
MLVFLVNDTVWLRSFRVPRIKLVFILKAVRGLFWLCGHACAFQNICLNIYLSEHVGLFCVCRQLFLCVAVGLWAGLIIGFVTEYYTSNAYRYLFWVSGSIYVSPFVVVQ